MDLYIINLGLSCWMETRRGYDHPRSQGEDEIFQESRRSLNLEITKLPEPRDTFQTCDIHCILFSSPSVFCDSNKILIFEFLYFYIYPCPCAQTLHGNKRLYFRSTKWENVQVFRRPVRLRQLQLRGVLIRGRGESTIPPPPNHLS